MKAYGIEGFRRGPGFLDVPEPEPGPGEIRIRVRASSANPVDALIAAGFFQGMQEYRFPVVLGRDVAGSVDAIGPGVTRYAVGDAVYGYVKRDYLGDGTFAEYVVAPEDMCVGPAPAGLGWAEAGALGQSGVTALECVEAVPSGEGDVVLVNGATGGVGTFAVQIAAARGATVIATARTAEQQSLVRKLGAAHVIDWTGGDLVTPVRAIAPDGIDGFVDLVKHAPSMQIGVGEDDAHARFAELCRGLLRPGGRASSVTNGGLADLLGGIECTNVHSTPTPESLARLAAMVESGSVVVPVHAVFPFTDIGAAFDLLARGPALGKISIVMEPS